MQLSVHEHKPDFRPACPAHRCVQSALLQQQMMGAPGMGMQPMQPGMPVRTGPQPMFGPGAGRVGQHKQAAKPRWGRLLARSMPPTILHR